MKSAYIFWKGFMIRWTVDGENYRYTIMKGPHLLAVVSGCGHEDNVAPDKKRMRESVNSWIRMTGAKVTSRGTSDE